MAELKHIPASTMTKIIRAVVRIILEDIAGFDVQMCASGKEAVSAIPDFNPDLDVMMPDMDGPETLKRLRDSPALAETPIVFMTAKAQTHEVQSYKDLGAVDVVTKPLDPLSLPDNIRSIWSRSGSQRAA